MRIIIKHAIIVRFTSFAFDLLPTPCMDLLLRLDFFAANVTNEGSARTSHLVATRFLDELLPASLPRTGPDFGVQNGFLYLETPLRLMFLFDLFAPQRNVGFLPALSTRFEFASSDGTAEYHFRLWQFIFLFRYDDDGSNYGSSGGSR